MGRGGGSSSSSSSSDKRYVVQYFHSGFNAGYGGHGGYYSSHPTGLSQMYGTSHNVYDSYYRNHQAPGSYAPTSNYPTGYDSRQHPSGYDPHSSHHPGSEHLQAPPSNIQEQVHSDPHSDDGSRQGSSTSARPDGRVSMSPFQSEELASQRAEFLSSKKEEPFPNLDDISVSLAVDTQSQASELPSLDDNTGSSQRVSVSRVSKGPGEGNLPSLTDPLAAERLAAQASSQHGESPDLSLNDDLLAGARAGAQGTAGGASSIGPLPPIVIDSGSALCKVGFGGDPLPHTVFPSIVGKVKHGGLMQAMGAQSTFVGDHAQQKRGILALTYPVQRGIIKDFDAVEQVWHHAIYDELRVNPEERNVMLTESPLNPLKNREAMGEIMFEKFKCPALYIASWAPLALYGLGRTTGIALEIGHGCCYTAPVVEGYTLAHAVKRVDLAGQDVTSRLQSLLTERGYSFSTAAEMEILQSMKEKHSYVAVDFEQELQKNASKVFELPDGQKIHLRHERFQCSEVLFQPSLLGMETKGIQNMICESIQACEIDVRASLYANIILGGGTSMLPGLGHRLLKEVCTLAPKSTKVNLIAHPERRFAVWRGGAVLADHPDFQPLWIPKEVYEEAGPSIFHNNIYQ